MQAKPKSSQFIKLNLLIACLKDKAEPEAYIEDYVRKTLMSIAESSEMPFHNAISKYLTQLAGLAKTKVGCSVLEDIGVLLKEPGKKHVIENAIFLGFSLFKEELDRARFLISALSDMSALPAEFFPGPAAYVSRIVASTADNLVHDELVRRIGMMPLERRQKILERISSLHYPPDLVKTTVEVWTSPEERSSLPPNLRIRTRLASASDA